MYSIIKDTSDIEVSKTQETSALTSIKQLLEDEVNRQKEDAINLAKLKETELAQKVKDQKAAELEELERIEQKKVEEKLAAEQIAISLKAIELKAKAEIDEPFIITELRTQHTLETDVMVRKNTKLSAINKLLKIVVCVFLFVIVVGGSAGIHFYNVDNNQLVYLKSKVAEKQQQLTLAINERNELQDKLATAPDPELVNSLKMQIANLKLQPTNTKSSIRLEHQSSTYVVPLTHKPNNGKTCNCAVGDPLCSCL